MQEDYNNRAIISPSHVIEKGNSTEEKSMTSPSRTSQSGRSIPEGKKGHVEENKRGQLVMEITVPGGTKGIGSRGNRQAGYWW